MAYNSQYTGAQIDEAIGDVRENKAAWSGKQDALLASGAKVGDLIKVKAVDASGKPTAWEIAVAGTDYLKTAPVTSVNGKTGAVTVRELPAVSASDNGKSVAVVNGAWAAVDKTPFYVNCTISDYDVYDTNVTHDKTYAEIMAAYQAGRPCYAVVEDSVYGPYYLPLVSLNTHNNFFDFALSEPVVESQGSQPYSSWFFIYIGADFAEGYKGSIYIVPYVNEGNEGQFLRVVNGKWTAATVPDANGGSF